MGLNSTGPQEAELRPLHALQQLVGRGRKGLRLQGSVRFSIVGIFVLAVLYTLYFARGLLAPIFIAFFLATLLRPFVRRLCRVGVPDPLGAAIVVPIFLAIVGYGAVQLSTPAGEWLDRAPILIRQVEFKLSALRESIDSAREATARLQEMTVLSGEGEGVPNDDEVVVMQGPTLGEQLMSNAQSAAFAALVVVVLLYLILAFGAETVRRLRGAIGDHHLRVEVTTTLAQLQSDIGTYLRTITVINIALGMVVAGAMALVGMPSPVLWGAMAGLLNFLPYVGPAVMFGVIGVVSLLTFNTLATILTPVLVLAVIQVLEGYLITPTIVGRKLTLNPLAVVFAFLFWGWIWGAAGVLLAIPMLIGLKIVFDNHPSLKPMRALIG